jgi:hypothetical protein
MAIQIVTLKTGDQIICELKELYTDEGEDRKGICLLVENPYILSIIESQQKYLTENYEEELQVKFSKWNPYSIDTKFKLPYDSVMTISSPESGLENAWKEKVNQLDKLEDGKSEN